MVTFFRQLNLVSFVVLFANNGTVDFRLKQTDSHSCFDKTTTSFNEPFYWMVILSSQFTINCRVFAFYLFLKEMTVHHYFVLCCDSLICHKLSVRLFSVSVIRKRIKIKQRYSNLIA